MKVPPAPGFPTVGGAFTSPRRAGRAAVLRLGLAALDLILIPVLLLWSALDHLQRLLVSWVEGGSRTGLTVPRIVASPLRGIDAVADGLGSLGRVGAKALGRPEQTLEWSTSVIEGRHRSLLARLP